MRCCLKKNLSYYFDKNSKLVKNSNVKIKDIIYYYAKHTGV